MRTLYLGKWLYTADAAGTVIEDFAMLTEGEQILWVKKREETDQTEADQVIDLIANGINNIHIYSMNKPEIAVAIMNNLSEIIKC